MIEPARAKNQWEIEKAHKENERQRRVINQLGAQ